MPLYSIAVVHAASDTVIVGTHSFTDGFKVSQKTPAIRTEDDALAWALWLQKHRSADEADASLEHYCVRNGGEQSRKPPG